jgi:hypothetical protein
VSTVITDEGLFIDGKRVTLLREEDGPAWQHHVVAGLVDIVEHGLWEVDEWGDMTAETEDDIRGTMKWMVELDGDRMELEVGSLTLTSDTGWSHDTESYRECALRLLAAVDGFNGWEE